MRSRRYNIPSLSAMTAFEAVARLKGFAKAADELNTSQPAVSRHIRNLEIRFGTQLFDREQSPIELTVKGNEFYASIVQGFDIVETALQNLRRPDNRVTLVCSHSVSHLLLMPDYDRIRRELGPGIELRIMTAEYNLLQAAIETGADIVFEYSDAEPEKDAVIVCEEEVKPVGVPEVVQQACRALKGECSPPALLDLKKDNFGWMEWADWKSAHADYAKWTVSKDFDSYVYLLEAAVSGAGLALGWQRFIDPYVQRGTLVEMPTDWYSRSTKLFAKLTQSGQSNPIAHRCLEVL